MALKPLILDFFTLGGCSGLEMTFFNSLYFSTDYEQLLLWVGLKGLILKFPLEVREEIMEGLIFNNFYLGGYSGFEMTNFG